MCRRVTIVESHCVAGIVIDCLPKVLSEFFGDYADDTLGEPRSPLVFELSQQPCASP